METIYSIKIESKEQLNFLNNKFKECSFNYDHYHTEIQKGKLYINTKPESWTWSHSVSYKAISFQQFLKLKNINIMKYKEGDILEHNKNKSKRKILGICGECYILSNSDDFNIASWFATEYQLDIANYKLFTEEPIKEVTLADISKAMNIPLDKLRIKD